MIFDRHANLKYKYGNRHFWARGYYVDTVGKYEDAIKEYIHNQLQDDIMNDQLSIKEFVDPFNNDVVVRLFNTLFRGLPQVWGPYRAWSNHRFNRWF